VEGAAMGVDYVDDLSLNMLKIVVFKKYEVDFFSTGSSVATLSVSTVSASFRLQRATLLPKIESASYSKKNSCSKRPEIAQSIKHKVWR
jgi:hypothetical protein